jgi:hypothetical protein
VSSILLWRSCHTDDAIKYEIVSQNFSFPDLPSILSHGDIPDFSSYNGKQPGAFVEVLISKWLSLNTEHSVALRRVVPTLP